MGLTQENKGDSALSPISKAPQGGQGETVRGMHLSNPEGVLLSHPPPWLVKWAEGMRQSGNRGLVIRVSVM